MIRRYEAYRKAHSKTPAPAQDQAGTLAGTVGGMEWDFDETIRGTVKGMPIHLDLEALDASIEQAAGPQRVPPADVSSPLTDTVKLTSALERDQDATDTVRPVRKEVDPRASEIGAGITAALSSDLGDLDAQDASTVGAIRDGFSELSSRNPDLIARLFDQLVVSHAQCVTSSGTRPTDDDLITDRSPIADLLYQRCE